MTQRNSFKNIQVLITEYNSSTGQSIRTIDSIHFGRILLESSSNPIIIKMNVIGVKSINNIRLGILDSSIDITGSGSIYEDNSVEYGIIGIEHSPIFYQKTNLTKFFPSLNIDDHPESSSNILINNSLNTESEFIYLNLKATTSITRGSIKYKWFFNFLL